jgi:dihydroxy-acid dehydratase
MSARGFNVPPEERKNEDFGNSIIAVVNSFTQFVPGLADPRALGCAAQREIKSAGGVAEGF